MNEWIPNVECNEGMAKALPLLHSPEVSTTLSPLFDRADCGLIDHEGLITNILTEEPGY